LSISAEPEALAALVSSLAVQVPDDRDVPGQIFLPFDAESDEMAGTADDFRWVDTELSFSVHVPLVTNSLAERRERWGSDRDAWDVEVLLHDPVRGDVDYWFRISGGPPLAWFDTFVRDESIEFAELVIADVGMRSVDLFTKMVDGDGEVTVDRFSCCMSDESADALSELDPDVAAVGRHPWY